MKKLLFLLLALPSIGQAQTSAGGALDAQSFTTLKVSTASVSSSVVMLLSTNTARVGILICNEDSTVMARIGPSTITATVGQYLGPGQCLTYDKPRYYRGSVWAISNGAAIKLSFTEATP